jgi:hypothetical protein
MIPVFRIGFAASRTLHQSGFGNAQGTTTLKTMPLVSHPWVQRPRMTLLHFPWQGLFIAILYAAMANFVTHVLPVRSPG